VRRDVGRVALVGAGVIGNAWAAHLLGHGLEVAVTDPAPGAEERLLRDVERAVPVLEQLGRELDGWRARLSFTGDVGKAVDGADFVQENAPERDDVKAAIFAELDALVPPDVVVASSSSSMLPSALAAMCPRHPERVVVGHPFNPVYLVPLVEVVGSPATPAAVVDAAMAFYTGVGKRPVHVRQELPGHLANRLQAALWREAYSLVERGVATVADLDAAISNGPGLRWALLGPVANQHLSGGDGGLAHVLAHLGPPTQALMDDLGTVTLTPELADALVSGVDEELAGIDMARLAAERDALLVDLLAAKANARVLP
jgi:3-hydroxyacyl-CoA dehydrogenase